MPLGVVEPVASEERARSDVEIVCASVQRDRSSAAVKENLRQFFHVLLPVKIVLSAECSVLSKCPNLNHPPGFRQPLRKSSRVRRQT